VLGLFGDLAACRARVTSHRVARDLGSDLRRSNLGKVLRLLHEDGAMRRADLTAKADLTRSSVLSLVDELKSLNLIDETDVVETHRPGRPSNLVEVNTLGIAVATAEIAVDWAHVAIIGLGGRVLARDDLRVHPKRTEPETVLALAETRLKELLRSCRPRPSLVGVGVAVHAMVDGDGALVAAPNLGWAAHLRVGAGWFGDRLPIVVGNDANLGVIGEHLRGAGRGIDDLLYISCERGVGGGMILNGAPVRGGIGLAGEVGHVRVREDGTRCACGRRGCWETEVGTAALARKALRKRVDVAQILEASADGQPAALAACRDVAWWLGAGIGSLMNVVQPRRVVVGGYLGDVLVAHREWVDQGLAHNAVAPVLAATDVVPSQLGADASLVGAAESAFAHVLADPVAVADGLRRTARPRDPRPARQRVRPAAMTPTSPVS
jgi:predicted NBD/HSP70 family sugar kinase